MTGLESPLVAGPLVALTAGLVATGVRLLEASASRVGLLSRPGPLNPESRPIPLTGGLALFFGLLPVLIVIHPSFLLAFVAALFVGTLDDLCDLPIPVRLAVWAFVGAVLGWLVVGHGAGAIVVVAVAATVISVGVNLLDGLDGLAGSVAAASLLGLTLLGSGGRLLGLSAVAAVLAFLVWNWAPARCYLGNSGSSLLGAWLVASALETTGGHLEGSTLWFAGLCVLVPAAEVVTTAVRRWRGGIGMFARERGHGYDQLVGRGWRVGTVAILYGGVQLVDACCAVVAKRWPAGRFFALVLAVTAVLLLIGWSCALRPPPAIDAEPTVI